MQNRALVLDANILIRAVLGQRVRRWLEAHADSIRFFIPETAYAEAEEHLSELVVKRGGLSDLDGRHRFLRVRRRNLDLREHRQLSHTLRGSMTDAAGSSILVIPYGS
jgi:predicted nucleic acid-binding protein